MLTDTLEELEWCLEQLETVQTHKSVSDMATSKVNTECSVPRERDEEYVRDNIIQNREKCKCPTRDSVCVCVNNNTFFALF